MNYKAKNCAEANSEALFAAIFPAVKGLLAMPRQRRLMTLIVSGRSFIAALKLFAERGS